ncbi:uncharacterized protein VICG_00189 [Vittaforma corneae ATCC 50505]|uniref:BRCT domain-containing protein n=1 Tax=Vittaforma corneae (strain ATCC 50505) TaxID=993615 RepID=L2GQH2_VITCO|nr:uncharacterized protein VICG_00189 [Vittaforma corneae ATCC 50505]ELA42874.1 hypothetical protein VICG_00189 [Vittaforma corneae ATCC 50505]
MGGYKHFRPAVKYVSRKTAVQKLNVSEKQFDKLSVMLGIYPVVADSKNCYDKVDGWYYRIEDVKTMFYSETYGILNRNLKKEAKRQKMLKFQQIERASKVIDEEFDLIDLVKQKYGSLGQSVDDLGNTLKNLYIIDLLSIDYVKEELESFRKFIIERKLLSKAFMSKKGIYFGFNVEKIIVCWMVPYPGANLADFVEEKVDSPDAKTVCNFDFLDFGSLSEEESEAAEITHTNSPDKLDISLLKYASPLLKIHLKLCVHKFGILYPKENGKKAGIFKNMRFFIDVKSISEQIAFVILSLDGEVASYGQAKFIITETVDAIDPENIYLQPQYVFDCLNQSKILPYDLYFVGKELPPHISPFPNAIDTIDSRALKLLSNKKKYSILDRVEALH